MKKFTSKKTEKQRFVKTLADLLLSGFTLLQAIEVIQRSHGFNAEKIGAFRDKLATGTQLSEVFQTLDFTASEIAQVQLAAEQGLLAETLGQIAKQLQLAAKQRRALRQVLSYPFLLLIFVSGVMVSLHQFLLPQLLASGMLSKRHWGILFLRYSPYVLFIFVLLLVLAYGLIQQFFKKSSALAQANFLSQIPVVKQFYRLFIANYFALEWGKLFQQGLEINQIIYVMQKTDSSSLLSQLATELDYALQKGESLSDKLQGYAFLPPEFSLIVFQGQATGKLGIELILYSKLCGQKLNSKVERAISLIQPLVFVVIAVLIISVYGALFLPLYGNIQLYN
ncbi:competence type IV pilus assembly protein ComGB [Enterococcus montenegrensis]|uniref:competence type IV pilus assembly protein ComGB n=1 Tax=Enterococcus montenegrensis TaxID=3031993 RepID=UPI00249F4239|nr:competence type IV pilus assembly protein ComGB [Enterococcus montenegrensis]WHA08978.1 competence type IV pilus assembly protein ComGB [Enterococcus montenegrensis]